MGALFGRCLLFLSSYSLAFALFAARITTSPGRPLAIGLAAVGTLIAAVVVWIAPRGVPPSPNKTVKLVEDRGPDVAGYLVGYLLPFLGTATPGTVASR
jgi:hypothetical protein